MLPENRSFLVRGEDGQEYGPVDLEELREWVQENRAGLGTEVRSDEPGADWNPWQNYPELIALSAEANAIAPAGGPPEMVIAPIWKRILAFVIDMILITIPTFIIFYVLVILCFPDWVVQDVVAFNRFLLDLEAGNQHPFVAPQPPQGAMIMAELVRDGVMALYFVGFNARHGKTPGKALLGLCVLDASGFKPSWWQSTLRALGLIFSVSLLFVPLLYAFFNPQRRTLHDLFAGTWVGEE